MIEFYKNWICPKCKIKYDKDLNTSINICGVGASTLGIGEIRPTIVGFST